MFEMLGISRRTAAAPAAMAVLLPLLVFVGPSPSAAHQQTTRRCDYDPISGQSYNCRNVPVSHVHPPNHYSPPPDTSPRPTTPPPNHYSPPPDTTPHPTITEPDDEDDDGQVCVRLGLWRRRAGRADCCGPCWRRR